MPKDNLLFKLDNLEYQYHYLNNSLDSFKPRLNQTSKLFNSKGRKNSKKIEKLLNSIAINDIESQLNDIKLKIFNNKIFSVEKNLNKTLLKRYKTLSSSNSNKDKDSDAKILKVCKSVDQYINYLVISKLLKISVPKIAGKQASNIPNWFVDHPYLVAINDKQNELNPSRIWNEVVLKIEDGEKLTSAIMNDKKSGEMLRVFEDGLNVFLGVNRDKKLATSKINEKEQNKVKENKKRKEMEDDDGGNLPLRNDSDDDDDDEEEVPQIDEDELVKQYEGLLAASDDEDMENNDQNSNVAYLDPSINYNEVTDEEPSEEEEEEEEEEEDSDNDQPDRKKQRVKLPELMTGYYSGDDSDSDIEEDKIAKEQASNKIKRKNRRGQRARRKIWEQKYGKEAKHVVREFEKNREEREQRQKDYEARVAKRAARQAELDKKNMNLIPLGERGARSRAAAAVVEKPKKVHEEHPSWVAKKLAEDKLKNAKFQGKKITFD